jgi:hypothetical protein
MYLHVHICSDMYSANMCMCVCVCVCVCLCVYMYICIVLIYVHMYITCIYMLACSCHCMYAEIYTPWDPAVWVAIFSLSLSLYIYIHIHIHTHTNTQTHTHTPRLTRHGDNAHVPGRGSASLQSCQKFSKVSVVVFYIEFVL